MESHIFASFLKADFEWEENWGGSILEREPSFQKCLHVGTWKLTCCFVHILPLSADRNRSSKIFQQFKIVVHSKKKGIVVHMGHSIMGWNPI